MLIAVMELNMEALAHFHVLVAIIYQVTKRRSAVMVLVQMVNGIRHHQHVMLVRNMNTKYVTSNTKKISSLHLIFYIIPIE